MCQASQSNMIGVNNLPFWLSLLPCYEQCFLIRFRDSDFRVLVEYSDRRVETG